MLTKSILKFTAVALVAFSGFAHAQENVTTRIQSVLAEAPESKVFSTVDARVYSVASANAVLLNQLNAAVKSSQPIHLVLNGDEIIGVRSTSLEERAQFSDAFVGTAEDTVRTLLLDEPAPSVPAVEGDTYQPTQLASMEDAERVFQSMDSNMRHKSQCYQRAHYWAHDMWSRSSVNSMKVFLFFTKKYIRDYRYKWWFHVAPFVYAGGVETVLDPEFLNHATEINEWSHKFVSAPENCPTAETYQEYEAGQYNHYCYFRKVPMYYYQPASVEESDRTRVARTDWNSWELRNSQCAKRFCWRVGGTPSDSSLLAQ